MAITGLDHISVETHDSDAGVAFSGGWGLGFAGRWGSDGHRAARLEAVAVAGAGLGAVPESNAFFSLDVPDAYAMEEAVKVVTPLEPTHRDTRWIRVEDPEGRVHCLEAHSEE